MRPTEEAAHLLALYRRLDAPGRCGLVRDIGKVAIKAAGLDGVHGEDFQNASTWPTGTPRKKAGAELTRMCFRWTEDAAEATAEEAFTAFAHIVMAYTKLDPALHVSAGTLRLVEGRKPRAWGSKRAYMQKLVAAHPGIGDEELYKIALSEVDREGSLFDVDAEGRLFELATGKVVPPKAFKRIFSGVTRGTNHG